MPSAPQYPHHLQYEYRRHPLARRLPNRFGRTADRRHHGHYRIRHPHFDEPHHAVFVLLDVPEAVICYGRIQELLLHIENKVTSQNPLRIHSAKELINTVDPEKNVPTVSGKNSPLLEFRHVTFRYDDAEEAALKDISFTLKAGETMAVMGDIGSGKSTLAKLILGCTPLNRETSSLTVSLFSHSP